VNCSVVRRVLVKRAQWLVPWEPGTVNPLAREALRLDYNAAGRLTGKTNAHIHTKEALESKARCLSR